MLERRKDVPALDRFLMSHRTCAKCGAPATLVDHYIAHNGDEALMFLEENLIPVCRECHSLTEATCERTQ